MISKYTRRFLKVAVPAILAVPALGLAQTIPVFSGADGAGKNITGGRGGIVYHVTKLDTKAGDNGPGTFQYGVNDANFIAADNSITKRTIVFDVGGTIFLGLNNEAGHPGSSLNCWDSTSTVSMGSNITVAGQTAPGGINIIGQVKVNGDRRAPIPASPNANVVFRNVTIGAGYGIRSTNATSGYHDGYTLDAMDINSNGVMIDHVSAFFASDETISANEGCNNTTIQYTSMSQGQSYPQADAQGGGAYKSHAYGNLWGIGSNALTTFSHNLYAHNNGRLPTAQTSTSALNPAGDPGFTDFRNNVVYNWYGTAGYGSSGSPGSINFFNNYYKVGLGGDGSSNNSTNFSIIPTSAGTGIFSNSSSTKVYQNGGNVRNNANGTLTNLTANSNFGGTSSSFLTSANPAAAMYGGITDTAAAAFANVMNYVGANWANRGAIDARIIAQVQNRTGKITALDDATNGYNSAGVYVTNNSDTEWNKLLAVRNASDGGIGGTGIYARAANFDTDQDGMPDTWELTHALNPSVADNNGDYDTDGYTNLEEYINELAEWPAPAPILFNAATNTRYAQITNWHFNQASSASTGDVWQPSKYDTAVVNTGTCVVDAVGQNAGTLKLGNLSGSTGTMNVTAGWLQAGTEVIVGATAGATGVLNLSGGELITPKFTKNANGTFNFTSGTLTLIGAGSNFGGPLTVPATGTLNLMIANAYPSATNLTNNGTVNIVGSHTLGQLSGTGATAVAGNGVVVSAKFVRQNGLSITNNAKVQIPTDGTNTGVSVVNSLSIASGGQMDLTNNDLIIRSTGAKSVVAAMVQSGKGGFDGNGLPLWNGTGINSSTAQSQNAALGVEVFTLGVIRNGDLDDINGTGSSYSTFSGQTVGAEDILVKYTYGGDSNLDGTVTIDDYNSIDAAFLGLIPTVGWASGDFDYNGSITIDDYNAIDTSFLYQGGQLTQSMTARRLNAFGADYIAHLEQVAAQFASVPEPTGASLLIAGAAMLLRRRRRA